MENKNQIDRLLLKYLANEVNAAERLFVEDWIDAEEENSRYFEYLKNVWQLSSVKQTLNYVLDEVNVNEEWDQVRQTIAESKARTQAQLEEIYSEGANPGRRSVVNRYLVRAAIAASMILAIGMGWRLLRQNRQETLVVEKGRKKTEVITLNVRHEVNTTGKEKRVSLSDGSLIVLSDKSEITYNEPFTGKRDITLFGKAYFKVSKNESSPFTVISGDFSTTALGTEFTVTAFQKHEIIIVRLYEGKVVVKAGKRMKDDIYLFPGEEFTYDSQPTIKLKAFQLKKAVAPEQLLNEEVFSDNPDLSQDEAGSWYMFNNQQLAQVLDQLAQLYNVEIVYDKRNVENIYFTGRYNRLESLETILKRIGTLNTLTITKKDNTFIITK